jgi:putative ABC transport system permease protein
MSIAHLARIWQQRFRSLFRRGSLDAELTRELSFHFEELVKEQLAEGQSLPEARRAAHRALGNVAVLEEQCRDQRRVNWLHDLHQDLIYGCRMLRKTPGFTAVAVASLALGIGANVAILRAFDRVLLDGLPFPDAERLVIVRTIPLDAPGQTTNASLPEFAAWRDRNRSFEAIGASIADSRDFGAEGDFVVERIGGQLFTPGVLSALGTQPMMGRFFTVDDTELDRPAVVVISHRLWIRRFEADPNVVGRVILLNGVPTSIVGVMPQDFLYLDRRADYWAPLPVRGVQLRGSPRFYVVLARLKATVTLQQAEADLTAIGADLARDFPDQNKGWGVRLQPIRHALFGWTLRPLLILQAAVALLLLIACANVAGLLLARGTVRGPEIALRMSLGAGRGRIIRQLLAEGVLLSLLGGALGIIVAWWGLRGFVVMSPPLGAPVIGELGLNARMFGVIALVALTSPLVFGLAPALASSKPDARGQLNALAREMRTPHHQHVRGALVAAQVGMALILLIAAGLLVNSFLRLAQRDLNFEPRGLLTFEYRIPAQEFLRPIGSVRGYPLYEITRPPSLLMERVYDRLRRVPGARSVAGISHRPLNSLLVPAMTVKVEGQTIATDAERARRTVTYFLVTPNFFATMGASFVSGRDVDARDVRSAPWVAVINETAARWLWPGEQPIGKRFTLDTVPDDQSREVVGVVRDIPLSQIQTDSRPVIYASYLQQPGRYRGPWANMFGQMTFVLRGSRTAMELAPAARKAVAEIDPNRPLANVAPVMLDLELGLRRRRPLALVLSGFALAATLLAAIGVYGLMAYSVTLRTREIGIRTALGASPRDVTMMVGRQAVVLVTIGLGAGLAGSVAWTQLIASQLWDVSPTDPLTFLGVSLLLVAVAIVASILPVRKALRVDPTVALKYE